MARSGTAVGLLVAALLGAALTACGTAAEAPPRLPADADQVVAEIGYGGGMVTDDVLLATPALAVYADGTAVANADRTLRLTGAEVGDLVARLRRELHGLPATVDVGAENRVADAGNSVLRVRHDDGTLQSVEAYALGVVPGYPAPLLAARDRLARLYERVRQHGTPYTATRIRLIAIERDPPTASVRNRPRADPPPPPDPRDRQDDPAGPVRDWPAAVPVPPRSPDFPGAGYRRTDLAGPAAAAVRSAWPERRTDHGRSWRLPDGSVVSVGWRYLLRHEPAR